MKKICMIIPSFTAKGGITSVVNGYKGTEIENKYHIHYIETYCDGNKLQKLLKALKSYIKFIKELIVFSPDIIHVHSSFGASFYRKLPFIHLASLFKIPVVNHNHGSAIGELYIDANRFKRWLVEKTFDKCQCIIVLSKEWAEKIKCIKMTTKIEVVENYSMVYEQSKKKINNKTILYLGFITQLKGCFDIPRIAEKVKNKCADFKFILAGSGLVDELKNELEEKKLINYFDFPGWVINEEKYELLRVADLFLLPSYSEGMPMSILEAMGYGLPIVASDVGGIPQLVKAGKNGFLEKPGDVDSFANAIVELLKDDEKRYKMGENSRKIAESNYSVEQHIEKICRIYNELLE